MAKFIILTVAILALLTGCKCHTTTYTVEVSYIFQPDKDTLYIKACKDCGCSDDEIYLRDGDLRYIKRNGTYSAASGVRSFKILNK